MNILRTVNCDNAECTHTTPNKRSLNNRSSDDDTMFESDYLTSVLKMVNGYCKLNLEVPQISSFYSSDSLLPINAKANCTLLNNETHNNITPDNVDMFKNVMHLKTNEHVDNLDEKQLHSSNKISIDEYKIYSKPSYSENSNYVDKKEHMGRSVSPKTRRKKKYIRSSNVSSTSYNQTLPISTQIHTDQNVYPDYRNQYRSERLDDGIQSKQEQELRKKQMKNMKSNITVSKSQTSLSHHSNSENAIQNDNLIPQSQCPLCFNLYPTPDIEAHASGCNI